MDHPRSRGVYSVGTRLLFVLRGSSPLARGLPRTRHQSPRGRPGSSPLARGLRRCRCAARTRTRIIPARAGFTHACRTRPYEAADHPRSRGVYPATATTYPSTRDHPRSRGVYVTGSTRAGRDGGSSPLARGLPDRVQGGIHQDRIIPARAGFTSPNPGPLPSAPDHPRSRGVYRIVLVCSATAIGIIPARAGFTWRPRPAGCVRRDHPRSRGVYGAIPEQRTPALGSSPLARGLHHGGPSRQGLVGIIPARAGFTRGRPKQTQPITDHPRSRGVYSALFRAFRHNGGSSPLARGLHQLIKQF